MPFFELFVISIAGLIGGAYGTLTGAGNILIVPLLIFFGYSPLETLAASKLGGLGVTSSGYYKFKKKGLVNHKISFFIAAFALAGSVIGTKFVLSVDEALLQRIMGIVIITLAIFSLIKKDSGLKSKEIKKRHYFTGAILSFIVGIYLGFIGLAAGALMIYIGTFVFGQTFLQSTATIKIPAFLSILASVFVFILGGKMLWALGLILFVSMSIGSYIGAHYSDKIGNVWLKRIVIATAAIMAIKLLF